MSLKIGQWCYYGDHLVMITGAIDQRSCWVADREGDHYAHDIAVCIDDLEDEDEAVERAIAMNLLWGYIDLIDEILGVYP